jgi:hypothetical protein
MFGLSLLMYCSYVQISGSFLAFQWDNLLLESSFLVLFIPGTTLKSPRTAESGWWARASALLSGSAFGIFLLRVLLFKLYFQSGLAKLESPAGDWLDGSAMRFYYETAPLPGPLAWYAHWLPAWFHELESWTTLAFELLLPFFCFGPRRLRYLALWVFTLFQIVNVLTANYGFFSYLSVALHVVLLDARDLRRWANRALRWLSVRLGAGVQGSRQWLRRFLRVVCLGGELSTSQPSSWGLGALARRVLARSHITLRSLFAARARLILSGAFTLVYVLLSLQQGLQQFVNREIRIWGLYQLDERLSLFRLVNTYHLFAQITTERIEPIFEVFADAHWQQLSFHYKPGPLDRALPLVAPHQPRVDFLLWFYGLRFRAAPPAYVRGLALSLCKDPAAVQTLFVEPLPSEAERVRVSFWQYHFSDRATREQTNALWTRQELGNSRAFECTSARP